MKIEAGNEDASGEVSSFPIESHSCQLVSQLRESV